jgi:hypothetical protein
MKKVLAERELTSEGPTLRPARKRGRSATVNLAESPLTWLHARGHVSDRQFDAGEGLPDAERSLGWPVRSGKLVLRIALDRVADYYRLP